MLATLAVDSPSNQKGTPTMTETATTAPTGISAENPDWLRLKAAATAIQALQVQDGSVPDAADHAAAAAHVRSHRRCRRSPGPGLPARCRATSKLLQPTSARWAEAGFGVPDFLDSLLAFQPQEQRRGRPPAPGGLPHVHPERQQQPPGGGRPDRGDLAGIHRRAGGRATTPTSCSSPSASWTSPPGYDTNSAVLFPETVAVRETPTFTWGAIFADREAARFRRVLEPPPTSPPWSCRPAPRSSSRTRN